MDNENMQNSHSKKIMDQITNDKFVILGLFGISLVGLLIRLYNTPFEIPFVLDATSYFAYSYELSQTFQFPYWSHFPNNGWPTFLSVFFMLTNSNNFMDFVLIQRFVTIGLSISTSIVIYFLCRNFFNKYISLIGAAIFCFEPRIILNSILGISEPLYIFLISISILFSLKKNSKYIYFAFLMAGFSTIVRYEGLLIIIPLSIIYLIKNRKEKKVILKYFSLILIFILAILPMMIIRTETMGQDGISSHYMASSTFLSNNIIQGMPSEDEIYRGDPQVNNLFYFMNLAFINFIKFFGLTMIPFFILFIPISLIFIFKNKSWKNLDSKLLMIILSLVILALPALFAYGRGIQETKYLLVLFPLFCIISMYGLNKMFLKFSRNKFFVIIIIIGLITISVIFIELKNEDYDHNKEVFEISRIIVGKTEVINTDPIEGNFLTVSGLMKIWPQSPSIGSSGGLITTLVKKPINNYKSIKEIIENENLTHLVIDEENSQKFLDDIFYNEEKYEFLEKIFDSKQGGYRYHVKIFQIDYNRYYEMKEVTLNDLK